MLEATSDSHGQGRRATQMVALSLMGFLIYCSAFATIVAGQDGAGEDNLPRYWEIHAWLLTVGTALFVTSYLALWLKFLSRIKGIELPALATQISRMWYKMHVYFAAAGVILVLAGAIWGYLMVDWAHNGHHLRLAHSYIGVIAGFAALAPLITGLAARAAKRGRYAIRWWHLAIGLVAIGVMVAGTISGWSLE
jgi:Fe2+ transport system protein B